MLVSIGVGVGGVGVGGAGEEGEVGEVGVSSERDWRLADSELRLRSDMEAGRDRLGT